ncbi:MAG: DNA repair protein RecN [Methylacidiphilales bacterium]|nr:DNA repair protein RecN [Candidatus Methylacidiphilales bacterium]MDW8348687.1 DNA repair protein RecN [Verrucomicrobiae bacterium]
MLRSLQIKNLALVDSIRWELGKGLNILTGETGAGKSILIEALQLLLGERADKSLIRTGEESCTVEAEFQIENPLLRKQINIWLEESGIEQDSENLLILKRILSTTGANRQYVNGNAAPLQLLKKIGDKLVDIHGPHEHQSLLIQATQLDLLDAFAKLNELKGAYKQYFQIWKNAERSLNEGQLSPETIALRLETLKEQVQEIRSAKIQEGEETKLEEDYRIAINSKQLTEYAQALYRLLDESEESVSQLLARTEKILKQWESLDPTAATLLEKNHQAIEYVRELAELIVARLEDPQMDAAYIDRLEARMDLFQRLKRKYGVPIHELNNLAEKYEQEIHDLSSHEARVEALKKEAEQYHKKALELAEEMHRKRKLAATNLAEKVQGELRDLGFLQAVFQVNLSRKESLEANGFDQIEFMFAPNPGEPLRPLRMIASSGEMARVMLAIKTTLAEVDEVPVLVFDEVDANVGGSTANKVGSKLRALGERRQVICITHLPQVAAHGHCHYVVEKEVKNERTYARLRLLDKKERLHEVSRMLGGLHEEAQALSEKLLQEASKLKV